MCRKSVGKIIVLFIFLIPVLLLGKETPLLIVSDTTDNKVGTRLEIYFPDENSYIPITETFTSLSFPVFCETTGLIGFTNFNDEAVPEVYLILPGEKKPKKKMEKAYLEDISSDGQLLLVTNNASTPALYLITLSDESIRCLTQNKFVTSACFSVDDLSVIYSIMSDNGKDDLYQLSLIDGQKTTLTNTRNISEFFPFFTLDGKTLLFMTDRTGQWGVDFFKTETMKRFQSKIWGRFPRLNSDNSLFAFEKDGSIVISDTDGKILSRNIKGKNPEWITLSRAKHLTDKQSDDSELHECWLLKNETYSYKLGDFLDPKTGTGQRISWNEDPFFYSVDIENNWARTNVNYDAKSEKRPDWMDQSGQALFTHSWTSLPKVVTPGETVKITLIVENEGSYGKVSGRFWGNLEWSYAFADRKQDLMYSEDQWEHIEAGGPFSTSEWKQKTTYAFDWIVPWPEQGGQDSERFPLVVTVSFRSTAGSVAEGFYTATYEYIP